MAREYLLITKFGQCRNHALKSTRCLKECILIYALSVRIYLIYRLSEWMRLINLLCI